MKKILVILFSLVTLLPLFFKINILFDFMINREFIVQELCEKKDVEDNSCQGKCHLSKELTQIDTNFNDKKPSTKTVQQIVESIYFTQLTKVYSIFNINKNLIKSCFIKPINKLLTPFKNKVFHPPTFSI